LNELGEKEAVKGVLSRLLPQGVEGMGDDAACIRIGSRYLVVSTDVISRRTHIPDCMTDYQIGWMAAAVNLSDIAAMGATPLGVVMAMGLPRSTESSSVMSMIDGIMDCCESVSAKYLGGDTKECPETTIAGTSLGMVRADGLLKRSGAKSGDLLALTGTVGLAGAAFYEIEDRDHDDRARKAALEPRPRIREGTLLSASGSVTSCMDTSDGLAMSVHELAGASGVGFEIDRDMIPVDQGAIDICKKHSKKVDDVALYSGGDYQLLFTIDPSGLDRVRAMMKANITVIGRATPDRRIILIRDGKRSPLEKKGYEHFKG